MADEKNVNPAPGAPLAVAAPQQLKQELALAEPAAIRAEPARDPDLDTKADEFVRSLLEMAPDSEQQRAQAKASVEAMASDTQKKAAEKMDLLRQPVRKLTEKGAEGGEVANALVNLKLKVEELDPGRIDFDPGWFSRAVGKLPGVGTPMKRYFTRYESAQTVISSIVRSLEQGRDQLNRDNITLTEDQKGMREATRKLEQAVKLGQLIDIKLQGRLGALGADDPKRKFISEELLFPLRQRVIDIQQQLAVNQQGVLATEIIIRNNQELVRGVNRALNVTVTALKVGATVAMALVDQKAVLDRVDSVNKTTSDLIAGTAARLKTQGTTIQKQASSAQLGIESLKAAFADINAAMNDLSNFRAQALPQMADTVLELDRVSGEAEQAIKRMEEGQRSRPQIKIDLEK